MERKDGLIATIKKNATEEIPISLTRYRGYELLDVRIYFEDDQGIWRPTKRGLTVRLEMLPDLLKALGRVRGELCRRGF
jgi:hypothetical protein